ncbi:MAG: hypothetical protein IPM96_04570 [Ignavibacteria bacterium]|nr:hypothetical protein [Ignavibacteria bacterium]
MSKKVISVFFDTNIFLHFKFISEINWNEIFPESDINYVIAPCIVKELDELKYKGITKKQRGRAKNILERFYKISEQDKCKIDNRNIEFISIEPSREVFEDYKLSETNVDDRLLASIVEFRSNSFNVCLITNDLGLILKAKNLGIDVKRLNEEYRIENELDEHEKVIVQLQKENLEMKEKKPNLKLIFNDEKDFIECNFNKPTNFSNYIDDYLRRIKDAYQPKTLEKENKIFPISKINQLLTTPISKLSFSPEYKKEEIDIYNRKLHQFYTEYEKYLNKYVSYLKLKETVLNLQIYLFNFGNVAGNNIRIKLHFPDGFEILEENEMMNQPKKPEPPELRSPYSFLDFFSTKDLINTHMFNSLRIQNLANQLNNPVNISDLSIKRPTVMMLVLKFKLSS